MAEAWWRNGGEMMMEELWRNDGGIMEEWRRNGGSEKWQRISRRIMAEDW